MIVNLKSALDDLSTKEQWEVLNQLSEFVKKEQLELEKHIIRTRHPDFLLEDKVRNMREWESAENVIERVMRRELGLHEFCIHESKVKSVRAVELELQKEGIEPDLRKRILSDLVKVKSVSKQVIVPKE